MRKIFFLCLAMLCACALKSFGQASRDRWVDSVFQTLKADEKIGQLFMLQGNDASADDKLISDIKSQIRSHGIGGVFYPGGNPTALTNTTNSFQKLSALPLLIGCGTPSRLGSGLDSAMLFPTADMLGAIRNDSLLYAAGRELARELRLVGAHISFSLPATVQKKSNANDSPVSFGSDRYNVARKSVALLRGLTDGGVLGCASHFSLNSLSVSDFQNGLPVFTASADSVAMYPFQALFKTGLGALMPAVTDIPVFYEKKNQSGKNDFTPGVMAALITGDYLHRQQNYEGLVFIDIRTTLGPSADYKSGEAEMYAFQAGNDVLLNPMDIGPAIRRIKKLIKKEKRYELQLDQSVRKILAAKYDAGLWKRTEASTDKLVEKLRTPHAQVLQQKLFAAAVTVVQNRNEVLPLKTLDGKKFAYVTTANTVTNNTVHHFLNKYVSVTPYFVNDASDIQATAKNLADKDVIIVGIFPESTSSTLEKTLRMVRQLKPAQQVVMCDFGRESFLSSAADFPTFVTAYTSNEETMRAVPEVIFGGLKADAHLAFDASPSLKAGTGVTTPALNRFVYSIPADAQMDERTLSRIDAIAREAIAIGATPGCNVFVARNGKVVYEKSYGYLTYANKIPVTDETIYDLASVTKVSATLQAVMFMQEKGMINVNKKASVYLPELKNSNKKDFTLKDMLTHQAGLWPFLPFWAQTMKDSVYLPAYYSREKNDAYPFEVADHLYANASIRDSLWNWIVKAKIRDKPSRTPYDYRYSDMGFYVMQHLAEKLLNQPIEDFLQQNLYEPLGASSTGYLPLLRFPVSRIAPTENDRLFRKTLLVGTVHDQGAAMLGGVAGHAGLFSNANDLAKLGQMLLQNGEYGGTQFYRPETVHYFTNRQFETSRRGLGWDKPTPGDPNGPTSLKASPKTFGHTGFTGTCIWVDPEYNLVYVFLSNRVHPDMTNNKLLNANIRSRIQDVIYESIFNYHP